MAVKGGDTCRLTRVSYITEDVKVKYRKWWEAVQLASIYKVHRR